MAFTIRNAILSDVPTIARIAVQGFEHSPMSQFERPCRAEYPEDWLASYTKEYTSIVQKGDGFLLVLDLKSANETVGFIAGSPSSASDENDGNGQADPEKKHDRSLDYYRRDLINKASDPIKRKFFKGAMEDNGLAVLPAHWGKGYGSALIAASKAKAHEEHFKYGVGAMNTSAGLFERAGFIVVARSHIVDGRPGKEADLRETFLLYDPAPERDGEHDWTKL